MTVLQKLERFFAKPFFSDSRTLLGLWIMLPVIAALVKVHSHNNYSIFRGVFWHTLQGTPLYIEYPSEYFDTNHYGPFFSLVIAPFALLPVWTGLLCWLVVMSLLLYWAVRKLPLSHRRQVFIYWFCAHELLTALFMSQFNIVIAAIIVGTFCCIEKEKDIWAALFIVVGTFVKLYGIVGLAFFFFSRHRVKFVLSLLAWSVVCFVLPMLLSSPEYIVSQYHDWYESLSEKNAANLFALHQNISFLGMVRKISGDPSYSDLWLIVPGLLLFGLPYLRTSQYKNLAFRYALLASVLLFTVLFSTGSESSTYIIAFIGVAVWYVTAPWKRNKWDVALLVFAFVLTSMSPSDLFPAWLRRTIVQPYALKALPCLLVWFKLCVEMMMRDYASTEVYKERELL